METIITIFTVLSMYLNASTSENSNFAYNADIENGAVKTMYVYERNGDSLKQKLAYHFNYDEEGRLIEKTTCRWNTVYNDYLPESQLQLTYHNDGYELALSQWNQEQKTWTPALEKALYCFDLDHLVSVNYLRLNQEGDYRTVEELTISNPYYNTLLAGSK